MSGTNLGIGQVCHKYCSDNLISRGKYDSSHCTVDYLMLTVDYLILIALLTILFEPFKHKHLPV